MACPLGGRQCNGPCGGMINGPIHCSLVFPPATKYAPTNKLNYLCAACAAKPECLSLAPFMEIAGPFDPPAPKMAALLRGVSSAPDRKQDHAAAALSVVVAWLNQTGYKLGSSKYLSGDFLAQLQDFCKAFTELLDSPHCSTPVAQGYALTACGLLVRNVEDPQLSDALIKAALKLATKALPARGAFASGDLCNGALDALGQGGVMMRPTDEKTKAVAAAGGVAWARRALAMGGSGYTYINGFNLLETLLPLSPPPADEVPELIEAMLAAVGKTDQDEARKSGFWMVLKLIGDDPQRAREAWKRGALDALKAMAKAAQDQHPNNSNDKNAAGVARGINTFAKGNPEAAKALVAAGALGWLRFVIAAPNFGPGCGDAAGAARLLAATDGALGAVKDPAELKGLVDDLVGALEGTAKADAAICASALLALLALLRNDAAAAGDKAANVAAAAAEALETHGANEDPACALAALAVLLSLPPALPDASADRAAAAAVAQLKKRADAGPGGPARGALAATLAGALLVRVLREAAAAGGGKKPDGAVGALLSVLKAFAGSGGNAAAPAPSAAAALALATADGGDALAEAQKGSAADLAKLAGETHGEARSMCAAAEKALGRAAGAPMGAAEKAEVERSEKDWRGDTLRKVQEALVKDEAEKFAEAALGRGGQNGPCVCTVM